MRLYLGALVLDVQQQYASGRLTPRFRRLSSKIAAAASFSICPDGRFLAGPAVDAGRPEGDASILFGP